MYSRVPLPIVFSAPGRRHAVSHCTYAVDADGAFARYLDSNDTRLPPHPAVVGRACAATAYDTYTGEDAWQHARDGDKDDDSERNDDNDDDEALAPLPSFDDVVAWVTRVLQEEAWAAEGVVLCGRYTVADDCAWAATSRSPTLRSVREVFVVMRSSCKFCRDVHAQRRRRDGDGGGRVELTLAQALAGAAAKEMRVLVPYALTHASPSDGGAAQLTASSGGVVARPLYAYAAVTQRHTDICIPALMSWSPEAHHDNYVAMTRRVQQAQLLPRACDADACFLARLVQRWRQRQQQRGCCVAATAAATTITTLPLILLLAVDVLYESVSLPVYVLSAKCRVYARDVDGVAAAALSPHAPLLLLLHTEGDKKTNNGDDDDDDDDADASPSANVGFFRLLRDVANWNAYVTHTDALLRREQEEEGEVRVDGECAAARATTTMAPPRRYCVVAHESSDLAVSNDAAVKRGVPLDIADPELLLRQLRTSTDTATLEMLQRLFNTLLPSRDAAAS